MQVGHIRRNVRSIVSTSERPSAARAALRGALDAFHGSQDGGTVNSLRLSGSGLRRAENQDLKRGGDMPRFLVETKRLYGAGELGGGHGLGEQVSAQHARIAHTGTDGCGGRFGLHIGNAALDSVFAHHFVGLHHHLLSLPRRTGAGGLGV